MPCHPKYNLPFLFISSFLWYVNIAIEDLSENPQNYKKEKMFVQQILAILVLVKTLEIDGFPTSSKVDETLIGSVDVAMPQIQTIEVRRR